jgi:hypothetical protein
MEKISLTDHMKNKEVLPSQEGEEYPEYKKRRRNYWMGHLLRKNCLLPRVIEGKIEGRIEVVGRRGIRRKKLLHHLRIGEMLES